MIIYLLEEPICSEKYSLFFNQFAGLKESAGHCASALIKAMCPDMISCWSTENSVLCVFVLIHFGTPSISQKGVTMHRFALLIFSPHIPAINLHLWVRSSRHPATAVITANSLSDWTSAVPLYTEVILFTTRQHHTDGPHFTHEEMLNSWRQKLQSKVCAPVLENPG